MDILDIIINIYEDKEQKKEYEAKFQELGDIYFKAEELYKSGKYREAKEQFMKAELKGKKVYTALLVDTPFLKRCAKRQNDCIDEMLK